MEISEEEQDSVQKVAPWNLEPLDEGKVNMEVNTLTQFGGAVTFSMASLSQ